MFFGPLFFAGHVQRERGEMAKWVDCKDRLPPTGETVLTKIDDASGVRNEQPLKRLSKLWFLPDGSMYVYYQPTHWKDYR